jgi:hypothetical protein
MPLLVNLRTGWAAGVGGGVRNVQNVTGGSGNDVLIAGASGSVLKGSDEAILLGGPGNDLLITGSRSLLIGGSGADHLTAGKDSILIGGTTVYVNEATGAVKLEALHRIMAEWTSSASLAQRVGHLNGTLRGGSNGHFFLNAATVHPTASADWFSAGTSGEWFLYGPTDVFAGRVNLANDRKTLV